MNFQMSPGHLSGSLNTDEGGVGRGDLGKKSLSTGHLVIWSWCPTQINPPLKANLSGAVGDGERFSLGRGKGSGDGWGGWLYNYVNVPNVTEPHTVKMVNFTLYVLYYNFFKEPKPNCPQSRCPCPDTQVHAQHSVSQRHPCPHLLQGPPQCRGSANSQSRMAVTLC